MMSYSIQVKTLPFDERHIRALKGNAQYRPYLDYPVVYILNNEKAAYIGETVAL